MARIEWALFCDHVFADEYGRANLIGVTQAVTVPRVPISLHAAAIALGVVGAEREQVQLAMRLFAPDGQQFSPERPDSISVEPIGRKAGDHLVVAIRFRGLPLSQFGTYRFQVYLSDDLAATIQMPVLEAKVH
jgi:hypothetical protein